MFLWVLLGPSSLSGEGIRPVAWRLCRVLPPLVRYVDVFVSFLWVGFVSIMAEWDFAGWALVVSIGIVRTWWCLDSKHACAT